jgi:spore photoproduct lyase
VSVILPAREPLQDVTKMDAYKPKRVLVQDRSWDDSATQEILSRLPGIETVTIHDPAAQSAGQETGYSKDTLILMHYPGSFLKQCQGSGAEICCNYYVVSYAWNCHFECTYCVLQSYLSSDALVVCTNIEDLMSDVRRTLASVPDRKFRIGTGELADSLALDHLTCYSRRLVPLFASLPNGILELKTKSVEISNLRDLEHGGHSVISWSVNSRRICRDEELKAASLDERLAAAVQCQEWGYRLGFHFDPIVCYEGWEEEYRSVVKEILHTVDPGRIAWISLGALRFPPRLRELVHQRYPKSMVPSGEFIPGHHGKDRYFRPIREEIYSRMRGWIHEEAPQVFVYLCMENRFVWEKSLGAAPNDTAQLSALLDARVFTA